MPADGWRALALACFLLLGAPAIAGCLTDEAGEPAETSGDRSEEPERAPPSEWRSNLSEQRYDEIDSRVVELEAEDGTRLSASVHLPAGAPDNARLPTLLTITPYQPLGVPETDDSPVTSASGPAGDFADYVLRGVAVVVADARGTGGSGGCLDFGGPADRSDARVFVEWIREQPWSNGRVVTDGVSHPGMGSLVAHVATNLTGALAHAPVVSYYRDEWYQGAKFEDQLNGAGYTAIETVPPAYTDPDAWAAQADTCHADTMLDFGRVQGPFTEKWAERDLARYTEDNASEPLMFTHGFLDVNVHPDHAQHYWDSLPEDAPTWLVLGWWYHGYPDMAGYGAEFEEILHRWMDRLLLERDNGALEEPRVLVEDETGTWHESDDWPLAPSSTVAFNATPEGGLTEAAADEGEVSYVDEPGADRRNWGQAKALFTTDPLEETKLVNGAPTVQLSASSSEEATKWVTYLVEITAEGETQRITHGYADSHTHGGADEWEPMEPDQRYEWEIELMPTAVVVEEGHSVGLLVASQDSRQTSGIAAVGGESDRVCWDHEQKSCYAPSGVVPAETKGRAENTVHTGPEGTSVELSWVDPAATDKPSWTSDS